MRKKTFISKDGDYVRFNIELEDGDIVENLTCHKDEWRIHEIKEQLHSLNADNEVVDELCSLYYRMGREH